MKKMVLVHVISNLGVGGAETVLYQLLKKLDSREFSHKVVYFHHGPYADKIKELGIPLYHVKGLVCPYDPVFLVRFFETIKKIAPDCMHTVLWAANFLGRLAARWYTIPLVQSVHNNMDQNGFIRRSIDRFSPKSSGQIIAVSKGVDASIRTYAPWIDATKVCVIQNGIDCHALEVAASKELASRQELGLEEDQFVIGTVGRFEAVKNYALLLIAFAVLYDKYRKERLVLVGQGSQEQFLKRRAYYLGINEQVVFVTNKPAYRYYPLFDCFVLTSYKEGLSIALLEAMGAGIACIVTCSESTHDVIIHNHNGILIPAGQPDLLANAIDKLAQDKDLRDRLGKAARFTVEQSFTLNVMIQGYAKVYKKAVQG